MTHEELAEMLAAFKFDMHWDLDTPAFDDLVDALDGCHGGPGEVARIQEVLAKAEASVPPGWKAARYSGALWMFDVAKRLVESGGLPPPIDAPGAAPIKPPVPVKHGTVGEEIAKFVRGSKAELAAAAQDALVRKPPGYHLDAGLAAALLDDFELYRKAVTENYLEDDRSYRRQKSDGMDEEDLGSTPSMAVSAERMLRILPGVLKEFKPPSKLAEQVLQRLKAWEQALGRSR